MMMIFKNATIVLVMLIMASCSKRLIPATATTDETNTTVEIKYVPRDTTIYVHGDTVIISEKIPCPDVEYQQEKKNGGTKATVTLSKGQLTVACETDSLVAKINYLEKELSRTTVQRVTTTITMPPKRFIPKWVWWMLGFNIMYALARVAIWRYKIPVRL